MGEQTLLLHHLYQRITIEYESFKEVILTLDREEIYERSYVTESYKHIFELLIEHLEYFTFEELEELNKYPHIISSLHGGWMSTSDSHSNELLESIHNTIGRNQKKSKKFTVTKIY